MTRWTTLQVATTDRGVCTITLDRPARLNAVNPALAEELPSALAAASADDAVRVVVLTGAGRGFCAGLDLAEPAGLSATTRQAQLDDLAWVGHWVRAVQSCDKPVIAAINGVAAGAGFGLALACDIRLMSDAAVLTAGYIRRGLSPDAGVSWFLPQLIGLGRAMEVLLTGRDVSASEALTLGVVSHVMPTDDFGNAVQAYADRLADGPPIAFALTKRVVYAGVSRALDAQLRDELQQIKRCFASSDAQEALQAFRGRRVPKFSGT